MVGIISSVACYNFWNFPNIQNERLLLNFQFFLNKHHNLAALPFNKKNRNNLWNPFFQHKLFLHDVHACRTNDVSVQEKRKNDLWNFNSISLICSNNYYSAV